MARKANTPDTGDQAREAVRQLAMQLSGEETSVVCVQVRAMNYRVPGRDGNGGPAINPWKQALRIAIRAPLVILSLPFILVLGPLSDLGIEIFPSKVGCTIRVRGKESCAALPLADAVREAGNVVWLAWSHSQLAVLAADENGPRMLWRGTGQQRPELDLSQPILRWNDSSWVKFNLTPQEQERLAATKGRP